MDIYLVAAASSLSYSGWWADGCNSECYNPPLHSAGVHDGRQEIPQGQNPAARFGDTQWGIGAKVRIDVPDFYLSWHGWTGAIRTPSCNAASPFLFHFRVERDVNILKNNFDLSPAIGNSREFFSERVSMDI